jgi:hypothetical protein
MISRAPPGVVVIAPFVRIERDRDRDVPGWYVLLPNGHGWLCGDRAAALDEKHWHDRQWGRP